MGHENTLSPSSQAGSEQQQQQLMHVAGAAQPSYASCHQPVLLGVQLVFIPERTTH